MVITFTANWEKPRRKVRPWHRLFPRFRDVLIKRLSVVSRSRRTDMEQTTAYCQLLFHCIYCTTTWRNGQVKLNSPPSLRPLRHSLTWGRVIGSHLASKILLYTSKVPVTFNLRTRHVTQGCCWKCLTRNLVLQPTLQPFRNLPRCFVQRSSGWNENLSADLDPFDIDIPSPVFIFVFLYRLLKKFLRFYRFIQILFVRVFKVVRDFRLISWQTEWRKKYL